MGFSGGGGGNSGIAQEAHDRNRMYHAVARMQHGRGQRQDRRSDDAFYTYGAEGVLNALENGVVVSKCVIDFLNGDCRVLITTEIIQPEKSSCDCYSPLHTIAGLYSHFSQISPQSTARNAHITPAL